ncbi:threonine aldolase family protein [Paracoccus denitrificans]|jgi:threonine aldolase|uniref:L-threonine aldolase n=1 Tax=Paracoccus denitrificans (strain Pd 1222) TaxID=318586 RepID=A1B887_PARDP|nr:beta-eliminating lyase-related protein [Paracoccus denitrificans]ABL71731.1 L-threonine aldolase [Paracoccus denitrificans PD1222]MBB4628175.1 threonine aldolase [Paracoccus denitrificans]MCU7429240.1 beta-eliminating lyase-related protein [Paracoccus denitrificans]QAR28321.1 low specificity L-threonine aldolase [Paracoccus denitrificans]UPV98062.1 beta-eliminating lyase-related protein [Paracoccus denitrificans]
MNFASDNAGGVHPRIMAALAAANEGHVTSYGGDAITRAAQDRLRELFDAPEAAVHFVASGTAANALSLSLLSPGWGKVFCHADAHVQTSETGAPEFFTGGAKLVPIPGAGGKITPEALAEALLANGRDSVHAGRNAALTLTNATEWGTVYSPDEVEPLAAIACDAGLGLHMDGARFANALAGLDVAPADLTWRAGVDILSLGGTKNGCMGVEAVLIFDPARSEEFEFRRKRAGALVSKHRYLSAQILAWLEGDLWLQLARHANAMAHELALGLARLPGVRIDQRVESNAVFATIPSELHRRACEAGIGHHLWPHTQDAAEDEPVSIRLVCGWDTRIEDVTGALQALA